MSDIGVNSQEQYSEVSNNIYGDYKFQDSLFTNPTGATAYKAVGRNAYNRNADTSIKQAYSIPIDFVKREAESAQILITDTINDIENLMKKVYINPNINNDLLVAHQNLWDELHKNLYTTQPQAVSVYNNRVIDSLKINSVENLPQSNGIDISEKDLQESDGIVTILPFPPPSSDAYKDRKDEMVKVRIPIPGHINFEEINFAEKINSTTSRKFLEEFYYAIAHSTFSYFLQFRKLLKSLQREVYSIQLSLNQDFREVYENELQQKVAAHYDAWCKTAKHYSSRIAKTIISKPGAIPSTELDKISKEHAAKFQAFFAIKLNAVDSEIEDILQSLKRDLEENSLIFYTRYLAPGLKFSSEIGSPFDLDYQTTSFKKRFPFLTEEMLIASALLKGNFTSIMADVVDRHHIVMGKTDALMQLIHEKRKYANYISQLSIKGLPKPNVLLNVTNDVYAQIFSGAMISLTRKDTLKSDHQLLSGLDENDHPQYLLRDGGQIIGDIQVAEGITIDGVDLSDHTHTGADGSRKISSLDIDYGLARSSDYAQDAAKKPVSVSVGQFNVDIVNGLPRCDAVINIEVTDDIIDNYEYEIIYTEVN
jgi:hypothetical protein